MDNLTELITAAVDDVNTGGDDAGSESGGAVSDGVESGVGSGNTVIEISSTGNASTSADVATPVTVPTEDPLVKELEELGLKAPEEGQRENRIPYSRVKKIVENARKKLETAHAAALTEHSTKAHKAEARAREADIADEAARKDPARYLEILTAINPEFKKYISPRSDATTQPNRPTQASPATPIHASEEPPDPDHKFEDGSLGYTAEGYKRLMEWQATQAENRAFERHQRTITEERARQEAAAEVTRQARATSDAWRDQASKTWGKAFDDDYALNDKSEILAYMRANPTVPFPAAVSAVLQPKTQADRERIRKEIHDELNARPSAAVKNVSGSKKSIELPSGPRTMEDVIREAMASSGLSA